jgi:hypothetical protein
MSKRKKPPSKGLVVLNIILALVIFSSKFIFKLQLYSPSLVQGNVNGTWCTVVWVAKCLVKNLYAGSAHGRIPDATDTLKETRVPFYMNFAPLIFKSSNRRKCMLAKLWNIIFAWPKSTTKMTSQQITFFNLTTFRRCSRRCIWTSTLMILFYFWKLANDGWVKVDQQHEILGHPKSSLCLVNSF